MNNDELRASYKKVKQKSKIQIKLLSVERLARKGGGGGGGGGVGRWERKRARSREGKLGREC